MLEALHDAVEGEDATAVAAFFDPAVYDAMRTDIAELGASSALSSTAIDSYFASMFVSLKDIQFDPLVTGDCQGNDYHLVDPQTLLIADLTPISAVVENPAGGYSWVSDCAVGDSWYEERSEGWYSFLILKADDNWKIATFGLGSQ
jgi:hypothetical protein